MKPGQHNPVARLLVRFFPRPGRAALVLAFLVVSTTLSVQPAIAAGPAVTAEAASAITTTGATLHGKVNPEGMALTDCQFEYGIDASFGSTVPCNPAAASIPADSADHAVSAAVAGLTEGTTYYFRLLVATGSGTIRSSVEILATPGLPQIAGEGSVPGQSTALIGGFVDPEGSETTYHFEWGSTAGYGNTAPAGPDPSIGSGSEPAPVWARLSGLEIGQTYHFRIVATNTLGTVAGADNTFSTYVENGSPDGRAYEQVSPTEKNNSDVFPIGAMAAADGNGLMFTSRGGFAGALSQLGSLGNVYLARRGQGSWQTKSLMPPHGQLASDNAWPAFSDDLSLAVLEWVDPVSLDPQAIPEIDMYLRNNDADSYRVLNGTLSELGHPGIGGGFGWASSDFGKVALNSQMRLTSDAPAFCDFACTYENDHGVLRLASILPGGQAVSGYIGSGTSLGSRDHAVSGDGTRVFFSSPADSDAGGKQLYARENGTSTTLISGSERTLPGGLSGQLVFFQSAEEAHGNRVIFTTKNSLVDADANSTNDLYMYDFTRPMGERLTLISEDRDPSAPDGADIEGAYHESGGVVATSRDLRRVYFVAGNQLLGGEPTAPGEKLYLWDDTGASPKLSYIATLRPGFDSGDGHNWGAATVSASGFMRTSRTNAAGNFLAFLSKERLTPFENEGQEEIYLYDAEGASLNCVTCSSDAFPAAGYVTLSEGYDVTSPRNHLLQNVSTNGRVFFETSRGLLPRDSNGKADVYEYEAGRLHLISSGSGLSGSRFLDASASGGDIFFTTGDRLVGWDKDSNVDAYDARVAGGLPEPPPPPPPCEGDSCQPAPVVPVDPTPASSTFDGEGNVVQPHHCRRGRVRRHGKCVKRKQHGHGRPKRNAKTRSRG